MIKSLNLEREGDDQTLHDRIFSHPRLTWHWPIGVAPRGTKSQDNSHCPSIPRALDFFDIRPGGEEELRWPVEVTMYLPAQSVLNFLSQEEQL